MHTSELSRIAFGLVVPSVGSGLDERVDRFARWMSERMRLSFQRRDAASYEALADDVRGGRVDVAWLPPIVYVRLRDVVTPIGSILRGSAVTYEAALIVRADSKIRSVDALRGTRAGWVDRWSASGFVLPRVKLALLGVDPRTLFRTETFHGSHRSAVKALLEGACDVVGTYAHADENDNVTKGAWTEVEGADIRVLATFGAIPPDVLAARTAVGERVRERTFQAIADACADPEQQELLDTIFGGSELTEGFAPGYDSLLKALEMATTRGIFD